MSQVQFTPVPIIGMLGCCVPVVPGTTDTDAPIEQRVELCAIDANWIVGMVPTCDVHVRFICEMLGIDWPGLVEEANRDLEHANRGAPERQRHPQDAVRAHQEHFEGV